MNTLIGRILQQRDRRIGLIEERDHVLFGAVVLRRMLDDVEVLGQNRPGDDGEGRGEDDGVFHER